MALTSGTRLGPYEISAWIGAGGMGEVYRARDTNLGRQVAIKVLPTALADDADRLARFEREARTLASLNHPNIAQIYGLERSGSTQALVMELVEGPTLADRLAGGPIPVAEALAIAGQIAEAMDAAHEKGIIHRDLKPANIKVTLDDRVKVLDFGLAKALSVESLSDPSMSPTLTAMASQVGVILGTAAYMSPEQARGKPVDKRADIWAFGCVLYEMLTGRRPFAGDTVTDTLAAVLEREVDWARLPAATPASVRTLLRRALVKDPKRRLRDIADARIELEESRLTATPAYERPTGRTGSRTLVVVLAGLGVALGAAGWVVGRASRSTPLPSTPVTKLSVALDATLPAEGEGLFDLSPDSRRLVYAAVTGGRPQLFLRELDQFEGKPIVGTDNADDPAFSPDGTWIAFRADGKIKKVAMAGGAPVVLCDASDRDPLVWESDDSILFQSGTGGIWRVSAAGGTPTAVTKLQAGDVQHRSPAILPGGKALLYTSNLQVFLEPLPTGPRRALARGAGARYLATGHLVYVNEGTAYAVPFDAARLEVKGPPTAVVQGVRQTAAGTPQIAYSAAGLMVFVPGSQYAREDSLVSLDRGGTEQSAGVSALQVSMPRLAPGLDRVVVRLGAGHSDVRRGDLWAYDFGRGTRSRLTFDGVNTFPIWSPTGDRLAYSSGETGRYQIRLKTLDGTRPDELLPVVTETNYPFSWSADGRFLAGVSLAPATANDIWVYTLDTPPTSRLFVQTPFGEGAPTFSPAGSPMAPTRPAGERFICGRSPDPARNGPSPPTAAPNRYGHESRENSSTAVATT